MVLIKTNIETESRLGGALEAADKKGLGEIESSSMEVDAVKHRKAVFPAKKPDRTECSI